MPKNLQTYVEAERRLWERVGVRPLDRVVTLGLGRTCPRAGGGRRSTVRAPPQRIDLGYELEAAAAGNLTWRTVCLSGCGRAPRANHPDPNGGAEVARIFAARLPSAEFVVVAGAKHAPWLDDVTRDVERRHEYIGHRGIE